MIWLDLPLFIVSGLFFGLGFLYGWGLLRWFRQDFRWSYASVVGILSVICTTGTLVWYVRYGPLAWELVWSLFLPFATALAGMIWVDRELRRDRAKQQRELERLRERVCEQGELITRVEEIIDRHEQTTQARINELIGSLRDANAGARNYGPPEADKLKKPPAGLISFLDVTILSLQKRLSRY